MQTDNISEPIFSNTVGWFRYNYDQNRLEFLNHQTKLIVQTWIIPADQWQALPSKREYCENIVREATQQTASNQNEKSSAFTTFIISVISAVICWCWYLTDDTIVNTTKGLIIMMVGMFATIIAVSAFVTYKKH